jgi:F-type H+-transporting ATPase subunit b
MSDIQGLYLLAHAATAGAVEHAEPHAFGLNPMAWVALSMLVLILIALYLKVPGMLTSGLDASIAEIKKQLDEAKSLRAEAEALRQEYATKIAAMFDHARHEAEAIIAKAEADTTTTIGRREKMAADKIAAAERGAVDELRARAARAATTAAGQLIAAKHGAAADKALVDEAIGAI